jgi:phosphoribosylamine--glycine ligase
MGRHGIPTAAYAVHEDWESARRDLGRWSFPLVVKADGLAAGKGVHVLASAAAAEASLRSMLVDGLYGDAGRRVVIEECLSGPEISVFALSDGYSYRILGVAQDHKRALDGDRGPNTGGMGAYAPVSWVDSEILHEIEARIIAPTLAGMLDDGVPYRGFLYVGLMLTARGPQVLEYNCRLGDPEAQVLLPRLRGDFLQLLAAADSGDVGAADFTVEPEAAVGVVLASAGYPESPRTGVPVHGLEAARATGAAVYCAGVRREADGTLVTSGGRICTVVGRGVDVVEARERAYAALEKIHVEGAFARHDIAHQALEGSPWPSRASAS